MIQPPSSGPAIGATTVTMARSAMAMPRLEGANREISSVWVMGYMGPATAPCRARKKISSVMLVEMPHRNEASENSIVAQTKSRTSPNRRLRKPVSGSAMALETANEVMTQVPWLMLTPRLPAMVGRDTLAMVVSSTCMKVARHSPKAVSPKLAGTKAGTSACRPCAGSAWPRWSAGVAGAGGALSAVA